MLGVAGVAAWAGRVPLSSPTGAADQFDCVATPAQTEGPYFVDERLNRADIRLDPATQLLSAGIPLHLGISVGRVEGASCAPLAGALVDVWQCDALGVYSDVRDNNDRFDTRGKQFLRGYQVTDRNGQVEFLTVYPGWYRGRTVHIHFKVRVPHSNRGGREFTSQLYFDDALTDLVHGNPPYNSKGKRDTLNPQDGIYRAGNSGEGLLLRVERAAQGYRGNFSVGLRMS
jgi:protocatechuate 3,4-dioxygenase beta subunit